MPLGPDQIASSLKPILEQAEKVIDAAIARARITNVTVNCSFIPGLTRDIFYRDIRPRYLKAGWRTVHWRSDPRDGDYLHFVK